MCGVKGRVLVVDDDMDLAEMLGIVLRSEGLDPVFCHNGKDAVPAFRREAPDLVLLDLMLPGLDGLGGLPAAARGVHGPDRHAHRTRGHPRCRRGPAGRRR